MPTEIIGLFGSVTGGVQDSLAQVDVPSDGFIIGIDWDVRANLDADNEAISAELSFIATNQLTTNDVRGRLSSISQNIAFTTSGNSDCSMQKYVGPIDIPVAGGERLYIHVESTVGVTGQARCNVHLDTTRPAVRRSARRR